MGLIPIFCKVIKVFVSPEISNGVFLAKSFIELKAAVATVADPVTDLRLALKVSISRLVAKISLAKAPKPRPANTPIKFLDALSTDDMDVAVRPPAAPSLSSSTAARRASVASTLMPSVAISIVISCPPVAFDNDS